MHTTAWMFASLSLFLAQDPQPKSWTALVSIEQRDGESREILARALRALASGAGSTLHADEGRFFAFRFASREQGRQFLANADDLPGVTNAEWSSLLEAHAAPNDPWYAAQGNLHTIRAQEAWPLMPANAKTVPVVVIDSGVCVMHPDLAGKILSGGMNFSGGPWGGGPATTDVSDPAGHGTHVAGIIAASTGNGEGIAGVSPNARILPYRVFQFFGATTEAIVQGIDHARNKLKLEPSKVMNLSLGGTECNFENSLDLLAESIQACSDENFVVVASAGNGHSCSGQNVQCGSDAIVYPAYLDDVISVANTTNWDDKQSASQWGWPDVAAPGHLVISSFPTLTNWSATCQSLGYQQMTGTSMSSPTVAGLAAMLFAIPGVETNEQVRQLIFDTAVSVPLAADNPCGIPNPWVQHGRIDALNAVEAAWGLPQTPAPYGKKPRIEKLQGHAPWSKGYFVDQPFSSGLSLWLKSLYYQQIALHAIEMPEDGERLRIKSVEKNDSQKARLYFRGSIADSKPKTAIRLQLRAAVQSTDDKARKVSVRMFRYDKGQWTSAVELSLTGNGSFEDLSFPFTSHLDHLISDTGKMRFRIDGTWAKESSKEKKFSLLIDRAKIEFD